DWSGRSARRLRWMIVPGRGAGGAGKMNIASTNPPESDQCRKSKRSAGKENGLSRKQVAKKAHETCCTEAANCCKALVSPRAFGQSIMSDQTKTDRPNCLSEEPAGYSKQHFGNEHRNKIRPKSQDQGRKTYRRDPQCDQWPLRPDHVQQFTRWYLDCQSGKDADG